MSSKSIFYKPSLKDNHNRMTSIFNERLKIIWMILMWKDKTKIVFFDVAVAVHVAVVVNETKELLQGPIINTA